MFNTSSWKRLRGANQNLIFAITTLAVAAASRPAPAVVPTPTGFSVDISPSARILDALDSKNDGGITASQYYDIKYDESCDNPHLRIRARNKPAIMITNDILSAAPITSFSITINEGPYAFGTGDAAGDNFTNFIKNTMYTDPGVSISGSSVSGDKKTLTVNFNGLSAGKMAIFNIDLDTTDANMFAYPDYRMVLFGAPFEGESATTPATARATFTSQTAAPNTTVQSLEFIPLDDPDKFAQTPEYANENIRAYQDMDKMEVTRLGGAIPEPSACALALGAVGVIAAMRRSFSPVWPALGRP